MDPIIRAVSQAEWRELRRVRLQALADAPTAFGTTLDEASLFPEERWRDRARGSETSRQFLAWMGEEPIGIAGVFIEADHAEVVSIWVRPDVRGRGVARALVGAATAFAAAAGAGEVRLWVTESNAAAWALYEVLGFQPTGECQPLPSNPTMNEIELALRLGP